MNTISISDQVKFTSNGLLAKITAHIEELAQATDAARVSEEMLRYLDACARFHKYSSFNMWLILMSNPNATDVAGFRKWQSLNRYVKKGEHGIPILAPVIVNKDGDKLKDDKVLVGFKVVYVFDITQTEGDPLPYPPEWKSLEKDAELAVQLIRFAAKRGISVSEKPLERGVEGISRGGAIDLSPTAGTATLIHEIAHELLHQGSDQPVPASIRELEAESVAFVVARHFNLSNTRSSPNYVALHGADSKSILDHLERIRKTASEIITELEPDS
jgi:hypothetical protein